jgi:hypothetical protein
MADNSRHSLESTTVRGHVSRSGEHRFALLNEGLAAFLVVGALEAFSDRALAERRVDVAMVRLVAP